MLLQVDTLIPDPPRSPPTQNCSCDAPARTRMSLVPVILVTIAHCRLQKEERGGDTRTLHGRRRCLLLHSTIAVCTECNIFATSFTRHCNVDQGTVAGLPDRGARHVVKYMILLARFYDISRLKYNG